MLKTSHALVLLVVAVLALAGCATQGSTVGMQPVPITDFKMVAGKWAAVASVSTDLDAVLVEGGTIRFGSTARLDDKVTAAQTVLDQVDTGCLEVLDVRVPGSPALTRNQRCS